jgi:CHAT domain-containing protein
VKTFSEANASAIMVIWSESVDGAVDTSGASYLLVLTHSRPAEALSKARDLLARRPAAAEASFAHQAAGIALRDLGHIEEGLAELLRALRSARASGDTQREADVRATLGLSLEMAGDTRRGLAHLDRAVLLARDALTGRVLVRRGNALVYVGRREEALRDYNRAVEILRQRGDVLWEARSRVNRGLILLEMGQTRRADADFRHAERQYAQEGQEWELAVARHNRALVAATSGRVPEALQMLAEADQCYENLGTPMPDVAIDRCAVLLSGGLTADAHAETDAAIQRHATPGIHRTQKFAELLYSAAIAALAAGQPQTATERAEQAARLFRRQRRARWLARTRLVLVQARHTEGDTSLSAYRLACSVARQLDALRADESLDAHLLAGRLALLRGNPRAAQRYLSIAARRRTGPVVTQSRTWLARALLAESRGQEQEMLAACRRGLAVVAECQQMLGASEMRAAVTAYGAELAAIGQRAALRRGDARRLLAWSERWRATTQTVTPARPPAEEELARDMSALREVSRRLGHDLAASAQVTALQRERNRLERAVRDRILRTPGEAAARIRTLSLQELRPALADDTLVELVELDDVLHAVTVRRSGLQLHTVGSSADAARQVSLARYLLRRLASGRPLPDAGQAIARAGVLLQEAVLGPVAADLGAGALVIVPSGRLHAIPWGLLPSLREREVSVSPSATAWLRARSTSAPPDHRVTLVRGPGLQCADAEIKRLAGLYPRATVLGDCDATASRVLGELNGSWLAHIAAHGTFRADNPLFSDLLLEDGPLTVYDIEGIPSAPYRLVLSACDSGLGTAVGADELLGVASSLMPRGTTGIVAAIVPVNDEATWPVMASLHESVAAGSGFPQALRAAREAATSPLELATACSFVALGS